MAGKQVLVTGAYGFVGRYVARRLAEQGHFVRGLGHGAWGRDEWRQWGMAEWHTSDVTLDALLTYAGEPDLIVHCAGSGSVGFSMTHPAQDYQRTVGSTLAVLEFIRLHASGARLVMPSSAGVYGAAAKLPIAVGNALNPASPYGVHKLMAEQLCASYGRHFGIPSALVRLFSVYGIGIRKQLLWDACSKTAAGQPHFGGTGDETRDWIHVEDAAALMQAAGEQATPGCLVVNGGGGEAVTVRDVVQLVAEGFGGPPPVFSGVVRAGDPLHYQADIGGALALGWKPQRSWREEVPVYVQWFRSGAP